MRTPAAILSIALALAGCLKVPESDNTGLLMPLAAPDTAVRCSGSEAHVLTVDGSDYVQNRFTADRETRYYTFVAAPHELYMVTWSTSSSDYISYYNYGYSIALSARRASDDAVLWDAAGQKAFLDEGSTGGIVVGGEGPADYCLVAKGKAGSRDYYTSTLSLRVTRVSRSLAAGGGFTTEPTHGTRYFVFPVTSGAAYTVSWEDYTTSSFTYSADVRVNAGQLTPTAGTWSWKTSWFSDTHYGPFSAAATGSYYMEIVPYDYSYSSSDSRAAFRIKVD